MHLCTHASDYIFWSVSLREENLKKKINNQLKKRMYIFFEKKTSSQHHVTIDFNDASERTPTH